jgi:Leucine-rich repeat (LRR) protein
LNCSDNNLKILDLINNSQLTKLSCSNNKLSSLDLTNNKLIKYPYVEGNLFDKPIR